MKWFQAIRVYYGERLNQEDIDLWDEALLKYNASNDERCAAVIGASERSMKTRGYRATAADLIDWVMLSRNNWWKPGQGQTVSV
jgi:hypothetical protein